MPASCVRGFLFVVGFEACCGRSRMNAVYLCPWRLLQYIPVRNDRPGVWTNPAKKARTNESTTDRLGGRCCGRGGWRSAFLSHKIYLTRSERRVLVCREQVPGVT